MIHDPTEQDCPDCGQTVSLSDPHGHYFEEGPEGLTAQLCPEETLDDIAHLAQAPTLFDEGELSHDELVRLFQHLVDTGLAWSLQGSIGRLAADLIAAGLCKP